MTDKIKSKLDKYLEFDSSLIFKSDDFEKIRVKRLIRIFGGAIRDIGKNQIKINILKKEKKL